MSIISQLNKSDYEKKQKQKIDYELPYFITIVTLLATSGYGPYTIFKKIIEIKLLPVIQIEAEKILKKIDVLGLDPLTVLMQTSNKASSKPLGEFLNGYVSSIQGGGDVASYLKSKMKSAFDGYEDVQKQVVEKVKALVESYMTMQIVILAVYVIITATSSTGKPSSPGEFNPLYIVIILPPSITVLFLFAVHKMNKTKIHEVKLKKAAIIGVPGIIASLVIISVNIIDGYEPYLFGIVLIISSIWPMMKFRNIYQFAIDAELYTPSILRDIAEARKAGLGPEKCVVKACKRTDYGHFTVLVNAIANKMEWGISLEKIYSFIAKEVKDFQILINFRILFEIISAGGGNVNTLDSLASISEKIKTIEKSKREMLKPYIMIGFMLVGITSFITLFVIDSLTSVSMQTEINQEAKNILETQAHSNFKLLSLTIIAQSWLAGLFLGKITTGTYSGGFKYSIFLIILSMTAVLIIQQSIFKVESLFG